jgi:hypothetical protein
MMARDVFGNKKITKEDKYTRHKVQFSRADEAWEYFKMFLIILAAAMYCYFLFF